MTDDEFMAPTMTKLLLAAVGIALLIVPSQAAVPMVTEEVAPAPLELPEDRPVRAHASVGL